jgi:hypothetical protein
LTNLPCPAILALVKLTFTVAFVGSLFEEQSQRGTELPLANKSAGVFFYTELGKQNLLPKIDLTRQWRLKLSFKIQKENKIL